MFYAHILFIVRRLSRVVYKLFHQLSCHVFLMSGQLCILRYCEECLYTCSTCFEDFLTLPWILYDIMQREKILEPNWLLQIKPLFRWNYIIGVIQELLKNCSYFVLLVPYCRGQSCIRLKEHRNLLKIGGKGAFVNNFTRRRSILPSNIFAFE